MIQNILVYLIICFAIVYTIVGFYNSIKKKENNCSSNCSSNCIKKISKQN